MKDKRGKLRGRCLSCGCDEFEVQDTSRILCDYCGHSPMQHELKDEPMEPNTGNQSNMTGSASLQFASPPSSSSTSVYHSMHTVTDTSSETHNLIKHTNQSDMTCSGSVQFASPSSPKTTYDVRHISNEASLAKGITSDVTDLSIDLAPSKKASAPSDIETSLKSTDSFEVDVCSTPPLKKAKIMLSKYGQDLAKDLQKICNTNTAEILEDGNLFYAFCKPCNQKLALSKRTRLANYKKHTQLALHAANVSETNGPVPKAYSALIKRHPNVFVRDGLQAVCVDCGKAATISLVSKNLMANADLHIKSKNHVKKSTLKGASSSHKITSFFKDSQGSDAQSKDMPIQM